MESKKILLAVLALGFGFALTYTFNSFKAQALNQNANVYYSQTNLSGFR